MRFYHCSVSEYAKLIDAIMQCMLDSGDDRPVSVYRNKTGYTIVIGA